jgi:acetyl-CoA acetyltransferase
MEVHVLGVGMHPPSARESGKRLEEIVYSTARAALDDAGVDRRSLDHLTLGASDELDGRPISSMLLSPPAGGVLTDEMRVTDSGLSALCLAAARITAGEAHLGLVASWCKSSKTNVSDVMSFRAEPFFLRPIGIDDVVSDALWAQAQAEHHGVTPAEVNERVSAAQRRAELNPRGMRTAARTADEVGASPFTALPVRAGQRAPLTDGAVALVVASAEYVAKEGRQSLARLTGVGWSSESYALGGDRMRSTRASSLAWESALGSAGLQAPDDLDVIELETPTGYHEAAFVRQLKLTERVAVSPSGGTWAQNPHFCTGLINAAEAVLQAAGRAGPVQVKGARMTAAHGIHGFAAQGHAVAIFESAGS